jgi:hypothetical protein
MFSSLSALAELAASELRNGEELVKKKPVDDTSSCGDVVSSSKPLVFPKKRRRKTGDSSDASSEDKRRSSANVVKETDNVNKQKLCFDYKTFFSPSFKPFKMNTPSFPIILMAIMTTPQNEKFISFLSDNQSFIIINPAALSRVVLPVHFEDCVPSFEQFVDILATWGFCVGKRDQRFPNVLVYRHESFRRGEWEICLKMEILSAEESAANRLRYRNAFQALGENCDVGTEDNKDPESLRFDNEGEETRTVTPTEYRGKKVNLEQQELCTSRDPVSSLTQITRRASLLATGSVAIPRSAGRLSFPFATVGVSNTGVETLAMKEAEINSATDEVVSVALAALHRHRGDVEETHNTVDYGSDAPSDLKRHNTTPSSCQLDVMTEAFLERSIARKLQSRRESGLLGSNFSMTAFLARMGSCDSQAVMADMGAKVDAKAKVLLAEEQERRASLQGQGGQAEYDT